MNHGFVSLQYVNDNNGDDNDNDDKTTTKTSLTITKRYKLLKSNRHQSTPKENMYKYGMVMGFFLSKIIEFKRFNLIQK